MVTKLKYTAKVFLVAALAATLLMCAAPSGVTASAAPLSPEFDLSRIYLTNQLGRKVALEIGPEGDTLRFEGVLSKQVKLTGAEIQDIAMNLLSDMGISFLEFREMQAEVKASLAEPKPMTPEEREQFIADLIAMLNLPAHSGDIVGLFNKVAAGKSEEEALKETIIEAALDYKIPISALDAVERSWQTYDKKWQSFESSNRSKIIVDAFYAALQRRIDEYKAEKGYKGVLVFKATAVREGFTFVSDYMYEGALPNTQEWTLELMLDQTTVTGEDTLEGALNGELGSLAGHYEGWYTLKVKSRLKNFVQSCYHSMFWIWEQPQTKANLYNLANTVAQNVSCADCQNWTKIYDLSRGTTDPDDGSARAIVEWEVSGACEADMQENGSMAFGVSSERLESIRNNFSVNINNLHVKVGREKPYIGSYNGVVRLPITIRAVPNQKKTYLDYAEGPYTDTGAYESPMPPYTPSHIGCAEAAAAALSTALSGGAWMEEEYFWDHSIHNPWEDENGTIAPLLLSLTE